MGNGEQQSNVASILSPEQLQNVVSSIAHNAEDRCKLPITVVPIMDASIFFAVDFIRACTRPLYLAPMSIKTRGDIIDSGSLLTPIRSGTDIVLLDTIIDTGKTLTLALGLLPRLPKMIGTIVIKMDKCMNNPIFKEHDLDIHAAWYAKGDPWVVGYGLDTNGALRDLPFIGVQSNE